MRWRNFLNASETRNRKERKRGFQFKGKVVLITGAASGIGRAAALAFAKEGCRLALIDIDKGELEKLSDEIKASGRTWAQASATLRPRKASRKESRRRSKASAGGSTC